MSSLSPAVAATNGSRAVDATPAPKEKNGGGGGGGKDGSPAYAATALALMKGDWTTVGASSECKSYDEILEDIVAILLVRYVAAVAPLGTYPDLSIVSICTNVLQKHRDWPMEVTDGVIAELTEFCARILKGYKTEVPYHNQEHAHHVVLSTAKLVDMICYTPSTDRHRQHNNKLPPSYGLRNDPLALFAQVFAALIHDVEHQGLANRQLAAEKDRLAVLYNDQSIAENWSCYVCFSDFLQDEFVNLRRVLFENCNNNVDETVNADAVYLLFRKTVINLVLSTDIASPERTQIGKSKWKEAFGDPFETVERKLRAEQNGQRRRSLLTGRDFEIPNIQVQQGHQRRRGTGHTGYSEISNDGIGLSASQEEGEGEDSLSGTPEGSQNHDLDDSFIKEIKAGLSPSQQQRGGGGLGAHLSQHGASPDRKQSMEHSSIGSGGASPDRKQSMEPSSPGSGGMAAHVSQLGNNHNKWERRMSAASRSTTMTARYRQRLGILRTVDLSGETLETYSIGGGPGASTRHLGMSGASSVISADHAYSVDHDMDEPDTLKAEVLMETIMTAADVAHNLQGWPQMIKWSNRLYLELRKAYQAKRGINAQPRWFENQIGFLESYLLPLAHRLEDTGVFADFEFSKIVEDNRDRWLTEGYDEVQQIIQKGAELYPIVEEASS